jgi:hypothetical protein
MTFCNHEFTRLQLPLALGVAFQQNRRSLRQRARRAPSRAFGGNACGFVRASAFRLAWIVAARGISAFESCERSYFSAPPLAAVRRASSSERRMSIAIVDSGFASPFFSSCSIARTSESDSDGKLTDVSAVELLPFTA